MHYCHQSIEKSKLRAQSYALLNSINEDIIKIIQEYSTCQEHQKSQKPETTNIFHFDRHDYIPIVNYYLKYPYIQKLNEVVRLTKQILGEQGIPYDPQLNRNNHKNCPKLIVR